VFNGSAVVFIAAPDTALGRLSGLPQQGPLAYRVLLALFVALFGGAYAWLAREPIISRPLVAFSAIGKVTFVLAALALAMMGETGGRTALVVLPDLAFAALFTWWLRSPR
jgi:hypothetical protein